MTKVISQHSDLWTLRKIQSLVGMETIFLKKQIETVQSKYIVLKSGTTSSVKKECTVRLMTWSLSNGRGRWPRWSGCKKNLSAYHLTEKIDEQKDLAYFLI
ncbi:MAG: hypothetical protein D3908_03900 [Candidatus Electrothrix sp. AUS4]|nr:hypothetical protein [Candidatus Electrothrix sp. AUS4]